MTDGTNRTSSLGYNSKLQPTHFEISGNLVSQDYDYYNDGRIKFVHNTTDANFDRSYFYDHSGRLTENRTGGHARNDFGEMPYYETFGYDVWSNLTARATDTWNLQDHFEDLASYTNTRRDGWSYDADGRNTTIDTRTNTFDAAGRQVQMSAQSHEFNGTTYTGTQVRAHDADGGILREITTKSNAPGTVGTVYYLKSSVLGGKIIEELASGGQKTVGYVYTSGGQRLATQSNGQVTWKHATPAGTSELQTFASISGTIRVEFDPLGADVSLTAPETSPPNEGQGDIGAGHFAGIMDQRYSDMFNLSGGCRLDGFQASCSFAMMSVNTDTGYDEGEYHCYGLGCIFGGQSQQNPGNGSGSGSIHETGHTGTSTQTGSTGTSAQSDGHGYFSMFGMGYMASPMPSIGNFDVLVPISFQETIGVGIYITASGIMMPQESGNLRNFRAAVAATRTILQGNNPCSQLFGGAGVAALDGIADAVNAAGDNAFQPLVGASTGIRMEIPRAMSPSNAPVTTTGVYAAVSPSLVRINTNGSFVRSVSAGGGSLPRFGGYSPGSLESRVLQLLHETGHLAVTGTSPTLTGIRVGNQMRFYRMSALNHLLPLDGDDVALSGQNTDRVLNACRQQIDALR